MDETQFNIEPKYFLQILNTIDDGIYIADKDGKTLWMNEVSKKAFAPYGDLIGKNVAELELKGIFTPSAIRSALEARQTVTIVQRIEESRSLVTGHLILNQESEPEYVIAHSRDMVKLAASTPSIALEEINSLLQHYISGIKKMRPQQATNSQNSFVGQSQTHFLLSDLIEKMSAVDTTVLITGETGVGKNVIARKIHDDSERRARPFVHVNCAAMPETLIESELFGYQKGAFTGANSSGKTGLVKLAEQGTLFLDEISELPLHMQSKLLQLLQDKTYMPIGGSQTLKANVRIIAATNRNLDEMVNKKEFRADLYYRLNILPVRVPPIRERREDIFPLLYFYLQKFNTQHSKNRYYSTVLVEILNNYDWPGNIRELENLVERLVIMAERDEMLISDLPEGFQALRVEKETPFSLSALHSLADTLQSMEKKIIEQTYKKHKSTRRAAKELGITQSLLVRRLKKYNIDKNET